ncbi:MAG: site-specific integrase [Thermoguttaceae bacterium]|nr:site-specific integrase [Thermoguttaceae bacterium]
MGTVYKETFTKPLPPDARVIVRKGKRLAEWRDSKGKTRTAPLTAAGDRITVQAGTYTARYRDGAGVLRKVATGCRDRTAAESVLADLEKRAERVRGGLLTPGEAVVMDHQGALSPAHVDAYLDAMVAAGRDRGHIDNLKRQLGRLVRECPFLTMRDWSRDRLEAWLARQTRLGMSARTRNSYQAAAVAFCNWCVGSGRMITNPFARMPKASEEADRRRQRRALTEDELVRLLAVARRRPLVDAMTVRRGRHKGEAVATLTAGTRDRLERLGRERALMYKTLVLTGLRKAELASLTVGQLDLDADPPYLTLDAANEKNREGSTIPLRADLAADLRDWLAEKAAAAEEARRQAPTISIAPGRRDDGLPADTPLFTVPAGLVRILDRDLAAAGIPKRDDRGRTVDVHALRHTFGSLLSKSGVAPRTAQAAMRHSTIDLTMNVYTDPRLLDVAGAISSLPSLPLPTGQQEAANVVSRTGTGDSPASPLVPLLVQATGKRCISGSIPGKTAENRDQHTDVSSIAVSALPVNEKRPLTALVNGRLKEREKGFEPSTSSLGS